MSTEIEAFAVQFSGDLEAATSSQELEALKVKYLGKKGVVAGLMQGLRELSAADRPVAGLQVNALKEAFQRQLQAKQEKLVVAEEGRRLAAETLDVTLPGRRGTLGGRHLITQVLDEITDILVAMGFSVQYGPEVETDYYNFEALNMGPEHPARAMQDTFYITEHLLLRTHTSNVQVRAMESHRPPLRIATPGRAFRNEDISARAHVFFHQIEVLYIDKGVSFADLLATAEIFVQKLFGPTVEMRVRPSYFPFVEPGMEIDIRCLSCGGNGCVLCKQAGWIELGGAGMVHPEVLRYGGIDPDEYSGFAWGLGADRMAMLKYGVPDIRLFFENDLRFLSQF